MAPFLILSLLPFLISPSLSSIPSCSSGQFSVLLKTNNPVSLFCQVPLTRGSRALLSVLLIIVHFIKMLPINIMYKLLGVYNEEREKHTIFDDLYFHHLASIFREWPGAVSGGLLFLITFYFPLILVWFSFLLSLFLVLSPAFLSTVLQSEAVFALSFSSLSERFFFFVHAKAALA